MPNHVVMSQTQIGKLLLNTADFFLCGSPNTCHKSVHDIHFNMMEITIQYTLCLSSTPCLRNDLKGTKRQHSGKMSQIFKTEKTIEIQPVRPTKVCGKE